MQGSESEGSAQEVAFFDLSSTYERDPKVSSNGRCSKFGSGGVER